MNKKLFLTAALSLAITVIQAPNVLAMDDDVSAYKWGSWEKMVAPAAGPVVVPTAVVGAVPQPAYKPDPEPVPVKPAPSPPSPEPPPVQPKAGGVTFQGGSDTPPPPPPGLPVPGSTPSPGGVD